MIVTFIYKINDKKYYGKYIGYISDNYEVGLDKEISYKLYNIFRKFYSIKDEEEVSIGILGFNRDTYDYFSENEAKVFDLLYCDWSNQDPEIYLEGNLIK